MNKSLTKVEAQTALAETFDILPARVVIEDQSLVIDLQNEDMDIRDLSEVARIMGRYWGNVHIGLSYSEEDGIMTVLNKGPR